MKDERGFFEPSDQSDPVDGIRDQPQQEQTTALSTKGEGPSLSFRRAAPKKEFKAPSGFFSKWEE